MRFPSCPSLNSIIRGTSSEKDNFSLVETLAALISEIENNSKEYSLYLQEKIEILDRELSRDRFIDVDCYTFIFSL